MSFPATRLRRLRQTGVLRDLVRETSLEARHLVLPLFVHTGPRTAIGAMPGVDRLSIDDGGRRRRAPPRRSESRRVLLFGIPADKDEEGSGAWDDEGVVQLATRAIKAAHPDLVVIADVCLCEYTSHGHCGVLRSDGVVDNDQTLELLARTAVSHAEAGADVIAPSDMMDGRVGHLRAALDEAGSPRRRSWPTARSTPPPSTARSATRPTRRPQRATGAATRWIRPTATRRCARCASTSRRAPTS